jgi:hypothetical protein
MLDEHGHLVLQDNLDRGSYRQTRLDMMSQAKGRSAKKKTTVERMVFQSKLNELMEVPEVNFEKKKITGLNPDLIKRNKDLKTDKERGELKRKKKRLFLDFLGCGGWR